MKRLLTLCLGLALALPALAKRAAEDRAEPGASRPAPPANKPQIQPEVVQPPVALAIQPSVKGLAVRDGSLVAFVKGEAGDRLVAFDAGGKEAKQLLVAAARVDRWVLSADGKRVAYVAAGRLRVAEIGAADVEVAADPGVPFTFAPDGRVAWNAGGKIVLATAGRGELAEILPAEGLLLGNALAFSSDGKRLFTLVAGASAAEPDGIGSADLTAEKPVVTRLYQASGAVLSFLEVSSDGAWLMYVQTTVTEPRQSALRLLSADGTEFRTLVRAPSIQDPVFVPGAARAVFVAQGVNRQWNVFEAGLEPDPRLGAIPTRKLTDENDARFQRPAPAADALTVFVATEPAPGKVFLLKR